MLHVQVVTPEKVLIDQEADEIIVPTTAGELTILPHHVPLVTQIAEGELVVKTHGKSESIALMGGFLEVTAKSVSILADYAALGKDISVIAAEEAKKRAEKAMKEKKSDVDFAMAEAEFRRAILELRVANRNKSH
ncbi:MAG TPA: ATP synthase F1 subunit epsilon [Patescibacteria group bacterium]|nr:ATP synthase F1 subunit epsilon [Patescibacteria group bacterium]